MVDNTHDLSFEVVARCSNAMETELLPATLREHDIPHRAVRDPNGEVLLLVPREWKHEADEVLAHARTVFFNETESPRTPVDAPAAETASTGEQTSDTDTDDDDDDAGHFRHQALFSRSRGLVSPYKTHPRSLRLAWGLAAMPGLGLGSLYAGSTQLGILLMLSTVTGIGYFLYQGGAWGLVVVGFCWLIDLIWAPRQVREHNRNARMLEQEAAAAEQEFLKTVQKQ